MSISLVIGCITNVMAAIFFGALTFIIVRLYCLHSQQLGVILKRSGNTDKEGHTMYAIYHYIDGDCYKFIASFDNEDIAVNCCDLLNKATSISKDESFFPEEYRCYDTTDREDHKRLS